MTGAPCGELAALTASVLVFLVALPGPLAWALLRGRPWLDRMMVALAIGICVLAAIGYVLMSAGRLEYSILLRWYVVVILSAGAAAAVVRHRDIAGIPGALRRWRPGADVPVVVMVAAAVLIGASLRLRYPLDHVALQAADPYIHLAWVKSDVTGIFPTLNYPFREQSFYPRGLHMMVFFLANAAGTDYYAVFRFLGAIFGVISILASYLFVSRFVTPRAGAFAALAYAGLPMFDRWVERQNQTIPETIALALIPICLYLTFTVMKELGAKRIPWGAVGAFVMGVLALSLMHHLSLLFLLIGLVLFFYYWVYFHGQGVRGSRLWIFLIIMVFFPIYFVLIYNTAFNATYSIKIMEMFRPKTILMTPSIAVVCVLFASMFWLGGKAKRPQYHFIGILGLMVQLIHITGMFVPPDFVGREGILNAMLVSWALGIVIFETAERRLLSYMIESLRGVARGGPARRMGGGYVDRAVFIPWLKHSRTIHYTVVVAGIGCYLAFSVWKAPAIWAAGFFAAAVSAGLAAPILMERAGVRPRLPHQDSPIIGRGRLRLSERTVFGALVAGALVVMLLVPYQTMDRYYVYGYEENVTTALRITEEFDLSNVTVYSEMETPSINREGAIVEPEAIHYELASLLVSGPNDWAPQRDTTFIFIEKTTFHQIDAYKIPYWDMRNKRQQDAMDWVESYNALKKPGIAVDTYEETDYLVVFKITRT